MDFWIRRADDGLVQWWLALAAVGAGVGTLFGAFGAGGSAFATPLLALLGVHGALAVASPLPAMLPASFAGARRSLRAGRVDRRVAALSAAGGIPGALVGAAASRFVGGQVLLVLSGLLLFVVGARVLLPDRAAAQAACTRRRNRPAFVVGAALAVGLVTGLLANGGGFLFVPLFIVVLGFGAHEATGTSMVAVGAVAIPTLAVHSAIGHIDWAVAAVFAAGMIPGAAAGSRLATRASNDGIRRAFGAMLVAFAVWFLVRELTA